jgi:hypothetical protein
MSALTDFLLWAGLDPHPGRAQIVIVVLGGIAVLWVLGMCVERVLEL